MIFFSSIRGSVLNHFNFNCVLEGSVLTKTLLPFCVFSSTVDTTTRVKRGDLFSYSLKTSSKGEATSCKPRELYGDLIEFYGAEGGWVMDFCSGSGELFGIFFPVNIFFSKFSFQHPRPISFCYKLCCQKTQQSRHPFLLSINLNKKNVMIRLLFVNRNRNWFLLALDCYQSLRIVTLARTPKHAREKMFTHKTCSREPISISDYK